MTIEWDPILFVNLILCIIIVLLGYLCYRKSHELLPVFIGAAFGLFGISHAATLLGFKVPLTIPLIIIRTLAYLLVIYALWIHLKTSMIAKEAKQAWVEFFQEESKPVTAGDVQADGKKEYVFLPIHAILPGNHSYFSCICASASSREP